ncbi:MBL fold metallo-hydrolase [Streptomyces coeruleorubidus]|uniref:MBL fold metallo-hydrolase n=1 Tax=Streptomyces coeruleorubidus TaxID=116188 RepID=UPI00379BE799
MRTCSPRTRHTGPQLDRIGLRRHRVARRTSGDHRIAAADQPGGGARHPPFAVRIETVGRSLVYSGDTAPCPSLTELAEGCDVLLCEAESAQAPAEGDQVHHTPEDAGNTARAGRAGRLIVTHVGRFLTPQQAVARASARFDGPVHPGCRHLHDRSDHDRLDGLDELTTCEACCHIDPTRQSESDVEEADLAQAL